MQRYQVNVSFLVKLAVMSSVGLAVLGGLYYWQSIRGASKLLELAEIEKEKENYYGAGLNLWRYCRIQQDDVARAEEMADAFAKAAVQKDLDIRERESAVGFIEAITRKHRNNKKIRQGLVDLLQGMNRVKQASDHLELMLRDDPNNTQLKADLAVCYQKMRQHEDGLKLSSEMIGLDRETGEFDPAKASAPHEIVGYTSTVDFLSYTRADPALSDKVMDRAVEVNPESADAYSARGRYIAGKGDEYRDAAIADLEKAIELDAGHVDALLLRSRFYAIDEDYDKAKELLSKALEQAPDNAALYRDMSNVVAAQTKDQGQAIKWIEKGVQNTTGQGQLRMMLHHAEALISAGRLDEARRLTKDLTSNLRFNADYARYLEARILFSENRWFKAAKKMEEARTAFDNQPNMSQSINMVLAICYSRLQQWERVLESAERVLRINPMSREGRDFRRTARARLGQKSDSTDENSINAVVKNMKNKPVDEQDWDTVLQKVAAIVDEDITEGRRKESDKLLIMAEINASAKRYREARKLIRQAIEIDKTNVHTWRMACRLTASDPNQGAVKALKMLDQVVDRFGDLPLLRLERADLLMVMREEDTPERLLSVAEGHESWDKKDQVMLWQGLARRFELLQASEELALAREKVAELAPRELSNLMDLFIAARQDNDDHRMEKAQQMILEVVGSKDDANWLYTEAQRLLSRHARGLEDKSALRDAEELITRAKEDRPEWHLLHLLLADLAVERRDLSAALAHLDRAAELGAPSGRALIQHVKLLMQQGRHDDAREQIERAPEDYRIRLLGREYAESLLRSRYLGEKKRWDESIDIATQFGELAPENGMVQLWLGRFMLTAARSSRVSESAQEAAAEKAGLAFAKTVELTPKSEQAWLSYFGYLSITKKEAEAIEAARQMQLALDEDQLPLVLGAAHQLLNRWFDAENTYRLALEDNPDNPVLLKTLGAFYLEGGYPLKDKAEKATPLINKLLTLAAEDSSLASNPSVMWARRAAAKMLSGTRDYQQALDAERLLRSNVVDGSLSPADKLLMARILATRPEPSSKIRAMELFENVEQAQDLKPGEELVLGQLYYVTGDWEKCRRRMAELIGRYPKFLAARDAYVRMLLDRGGKRNVEVAERNVKEMQKLEPNSPDTIELAVQVLKKVGREKQVLPILGRLLSREEIRKDPRTLLRIGAMLTDLEQYDNAEKLYKAAAKLTPVAKPHLAQFLGRHRDVDQALMVLKEAESEITTPAALQQAILVLGFKGDDAAQEHVEKVEEWMASALRVDPESIPLLIQNAQLLDTRKKYAESADQYRKLLDRNDLRGQDRAIVLNNLAYQLALSSSQKPDFEEAMKYVKEAIYLLGPQAAILDTRAVVYMALGKNKLAVADMELAVLDNPTASKYFHKCRAHLLAQQDDKAIRAWDKAVEMGLSAEEVGIVERGVYEEVEGKIQQLKGGPPATDRAAA